MRVDPVTHAILIVLCAIVLLVGVGFGWLVTEIAKQPPRACETHIVPIPQYHPILKQVIVQNMVMCKPDAE